MRIPPYARAGIFVGLAIVGLLVSSAGVFDPIHEQLHVTQANAEGIAARVVNNNTAWIQTLTIDNITAGWKGMMLGFAFLSVLGAMIGRAFPLLTGGFAAGGMIRNYIDAYYSKDFHSVLHTFVSQNVPPERVEYVFTRMQNDLFDWWMRAGITTIAFTLIVCFAFILIPKRKGVRRG